MIVIRAFSPADIPEVMKVVQMSLGESYPPSLYLTVHNLWQDGFLVALDERRLVGFLAAVPTGGRVTRVLMLAVLPESRRRYLGRMLMKRLYESCSTRGMDTVILEVRKGNADALAFYEREGFEIFGEVKSFYTDGEDAWKLMKVLGT